MSEEVSKEQLSEMVASTRINKGIDGKPKDADTELKQRIAGFYNDHKSNFKANHHVTYAFCVMFIPSETKTLIDLLGLLKDERVYIIANINEPDFDGFDITDFQNKNIVSVNHHVFKGYNYIDDFSLMRNRFFDMEQVNADWLFFLDADERVADHFRPHLKDVCAAADHIHADVIQLPIIEHNQREVIHHELKRIIRKSSKVRFQGYCHETVDFSQFEHGAKDVICNNLHIYHIGYLRYDDDSIFRKCQRNLTGLTAQAYEFFQTLKTGSVDGRFMLHYLKILHRDLTVYIDLLEKKLGVKE